MSWQQVRFRQGETETVGWVDMAQTPIRAGWSCTLKHQDGRFVAVEVYPTVAHTKPFQEWKVGGIEPRVR